MGESNNAGHIDASSTVGVLLVSEHVVVREGLRKLLADEPGLIVVGDVSNPAEAMAISRATKPVIVIVGFSGRPLVRLLRSLRQHAPDGEPRRTIVLTASLETQQVARAVRLGASGVLLKDASSRTLIDTIRSVAAGKTEIEAMAATGAGEDWSAQRRNGQVDGQRDFGLTTRELEIVAAVRRGDSNRVIARRFSLSQHTVKHHLTRVFEKTGVFSRLELAVFAMKNGLGDNAMSV
jgi:two-component system, NarL family, nitrate/nitrite response regulator NarL